MADTDYRYFWCDAPSPLHDLLEAFKAKRDAAYAEAKSLAVQVGATNAVGRGRIEGFLFKESPAPDLWRVGGLGPDGRYYAPKRSTKEGKAIHARMASINVPTKEQLLRDAGLYHMLFRPPYMLQSNIGWKDGRIFVVLPKADSMVGVEIDDERPVAAPEYLAECKKWEMDRWMDEGRQQ